MSEKKSKCELFIQDLDKALDALSKTQKLLDKAAGRLPKRTPKMVPDGSSLSQRYPASNLQDVLKDCSNVGVGKEEGILNGLMDTLNDIKKLAMGESGFEF